MQLFIGGACAGKRDVVRARFSDAVWWQLVPGQRLRECISHLLPNTPLVLHDVFEWLTAVVDADMSSDECRAQWRDDMAALQCAAERHNVVLVIIVSDISRGVVPIEREQRRLRDLNGWFSQDAAARAEQVWYVRHGLVKALHSL